MARWTDRVDWRREIFAKISHLGKVAMFNCMDCGDCALMDLAYLCPVSQCPKERRVGACGGSFEGWCEVYPGKKRCIWVKAYDRLQVYDEETTLRDYTVPPRDWELWQTPSQLNYYLGRDHTARRLNILPPP
jgi:methylenetetrahydrofolate reductase (NADPH)